MFRHFPHELGHLSLVVSALVSWRAGLVTWVLTLWALGGVYAVFTVLLAVDDGNAPPSLFHARPPVSMSIQPPAWLIVSVGRGGGKMAG